MDLQAIVDDVLTTLVGMLCGFAGVLVLAALVGAFYGFALFVGG